MTIPPNYIAVRGKDFCRGCHGENLFSGIDLGNLPLANELLASHDSQVEVFPLHLMICPDCRLGQVSDVVSPERIFNDYRYLSSISSTFLKHASDFVERVIQDELLAPDDWVLEIASNDGYLLRNFLPFGIKVIGIEPAKNIAQISRGLGIETISEFFTSELASGILLKHGSPKLIIANNVMAHVPDLLDFIRGLKILSGSETLISVENPSLSNILKDMQFDTIYHEHYSYLSGSAVNEICKRNGLQLIKVEELSIHGGSNRYWLSQHKPTNFIDESVGSIITSEENIKLFEPGEWENYSTKVSKVIENFLNWLTADFESPRRIYGYGAAAKASTIMNSIGEKSKPIRAIADASREKQTRFMPPIGVPIISPEELLAENPTDIVIFPWNIKQEIVSHLGAHLHHSVRFWCLIPEMKELHLHEI